MKVSQSKSSTPADPSSRNTGKPILPQTVQYFWTESRISTGGLGLYFLDSTTSRTTQRITERIRIASTVLRSIACGSQRASSTRSRFNQAENRSRYYTRETKKSIGTRRYAALYGYPPCK